MSRYTAEDLGRLAGLTGRTVRYYVAEKLISPPHGRGRGAHFDEGHLAQLKRVRLLQAGGLDLSQIREHLDELGAVLAARGLKLADMEKTWMYMGEQAAAAWRAPPRPTAEVKVARSTRIEVLPGLELLVSDAYRLPSPRQLADLAVLIARAFPESPEPRPSERGPRGAGRG
ncbi:MAG: MerR family transcriptional regulator [Phenylobacterium sp.]|nr:MerR family transcriptional regulator [Phenylobacterium sp.]MDB5442638.1 MerR family transcriptional regulator [Phenylobacterium sp.]